MKRTCNIINEPEREKTNNLGSDQVRHKPSCTVTEDDRRLEILDLESKGFVLSVQRNKGADQLRSYFEADLRLSFCLCRLLVFPCGGSIIGLSNVVVLAFLVSSIEVDLSYSTLMSICVVVPFVLCLGSNFCCLNLMYGFMFLFKGN